MIQRRKVARLIAGTLIVAGTAGAARADTRALSLFNTHTQERATIVFKRDGSYDAKGLQELNYMLRDWRRNEVTRMDPMLFDLVWSVYRQVGSQQPIHVVSGYRSPATNNALRNRSRGVAKFSQHMLGKAMDFYLPDVPLEKLRETGMKMQMGGVGFYPTSGSPFVHMDTGSVRAWPRMSREQLVRLFPDGKTAHLPADGNPLPGYQEALAEVQARKSSGGGPVETASSGGGGGLLAALFGGGSSSSSSTPSRAYSATPGDDEEEGASAAPAPVRAKPQELRQGPLPPGSDPKILARKGDTPPGLEPPPTRLAAAAPPPVPAPLPAPVPTATARGSLVAMPVTAPNAGPTRPAQVAAVAAEALPSRYGPGGALPPGWIQGPSGRQAGTAEAPQKPQQIAFTPGLKPMAAPLPQDRPGRGGPMESLALAALATGGTPFPGAPMPKPRPRGSVHLAEAAIPADAHAALSAFAGDTEGEVALGYAAAAPIEAAPAAPPAAAAEPMRTASIAPSLPARPAAPATTALPTPRAAAVPESRFAPHAAKSDRAGPTAPHVARTDRGDADRLLDTAVEIADDGAAVLKHPDQAALDPLMVKPRMSLATGFVTAALEAELGAHTFTGPAVVSLPVILTK